MFIHVVSKIAMDLFKIRDTKNYVSRTYSTKGAFVVAPNTCCAWIAPTSAYQDPGSNRLYFYLFLCYENDFKKHGLYLPYVYKYKKL